MLEIKSQFRVSHEETHEGQSLGVKIEVVDAIEPEMSKEEKLRFFEMCKEVGESQARTVIADNPDIGKVWIWVYPDGMDLNGPAVCTSFIERGAKPATEFTNFDVMAIWYIGNEPVKA